MSVVLLISAPDVESASMSAAVRCIALRSKLSLLIANHEWVVHVQRRGQQTSCGICPLKRKPSPSPSHWVLFHATNKMAHCDVEELISHILGIVVWLALEIIDIVQFFIRPLGVTVARWEVSCETVKDAIRNHSLRVKASSSQKSSPPFLSDSKWLDSFNFQLQTIGQSRDVPASRRLVLLRQVRDAALERLSIAKQLKNNPDISKVLNDYTQWGFLAPGLLDKVIQFFLVWQLRREIVNLCPWLSHVQAKRHLLLCSFTELSVRCDQLYYTLCYRWCYILFAT